MVTFGTAFMLFRYNHYCKLQKEMKAERRARERQQEEELRAKRQRKAIRMWKDAYGRGYAAGMRKSAADATLADRYHQLGGGDGQAWSTTYGHQSHHGGNGHHTLGSKSHHAHHQPRGHHSSGQNDYATGATGPATAAHKHNKGKYESNKGGYLMSGALPQETPAAQTANGGKDGKGSGYRAADKGVQATEVKSQPSKSAMKAAATQKPHVSHQGPANHSGDSHRSNKKKQSGYQKGDRHSV